MQTQRRFMKIEWRLFSLLLMVSVSLFVLNVKITVANKKLAAAEPEWSFNATLIEACSCPMFCQCYFNTEPAGHTSHAGHAAHGEGMEHFCLYNTAFKINRGHFGDVTLDGAKFWTAGDTGGDFSEGKMDWEVIHFDTSVTKAQREGILTILDHVFPVQWNSHTVGEDAAVEWKVTDTGAEARLNGGKSGEVVLQRLPGMTNEPVVIKNLVYWAAPRNDGFVLMPNLVEAYRLGEKPFVFKNSNGFMITIDATSKDFK